MKGSTNLFVNIFCLLIVAPLALASCPSSCLPYGKCVNGECECEYGFAGVDCSFKFQQCADGVLTCFDGAQCVRSSIRQEDATARSNYVCDCSSVPDASPFQIAECESPDSQVCEVGQKTSDYAFCTNGGTCVGMIRHGEPHSGCVCPHEFEGRHCQYRKGTAPAEELQIAYAEKRNHVAGYFIFLIVALVFALVGCFLLAIYDKTWFKKTKESRVQATLSDLRLEDSGDEEDTEVTKGEMA